MYKYEMFMHNSFHMRAITHTHTSKDGMEKREFCMKIIKMNDAFWFIEI